MQQPSRSGLGRSATPQRWRQWLILVPVCWQGYLAALSASSYSYVSMLQHFGPIINPGGAALSLTYLASERIIPGAAPPSRTSPSCPLLSVCRP